MNTAILLVLSALGPWIVHMAPPKQRPMALVAVIGLLLLFGIFASNPLTDWALWGGAAVGVVSVLLLGPSIAPTRRRRARRRPNRPDLAGDGDAGDIFGGEHS